MSRPPSIKGNPSSLNGEVTLFHRPRREDDDAVYFSPPNYPEYIARLTKIYGSLSDGTIFHYHPDNRVIIWTASRIKVFRESLQMELH